MKRISNFWKGVALLAAPFLWFGQIASASDAGERPAAETVLRASSKWALNYSEDSCRVGRFFGEGDQRTLLQMTQFEPDHVFMLAIAGGGLGKKINASRARVQFGPVHPLRDDVEPQDGDIGDFKPGLIFSNIAVREAQRPDPSQKAKDMERIFNFEANDPVTIEDEAKVEWIEIAVGKKPRLRLLTGPMGDLFKALNTCSEELLLHWGLDVERHRTLSRKAFPLQSPGKWITSEDYPSSSLAKGERAIIYFRLMIDENGGPESCHIQQSGYSEAFDRAVCDNLMRNARFEPALDSEGVPIKSYYRTSVLFQIP